MAILPPAAQHKLGSPWIGPNQVVRNATGHTVGIHKCPEKPIVFVHVDNLKLCPAPQDVSWNPGASTAKSLCTSTVAFRPGFVLYMYLVMYSNEMGPCNGSFVCHM